MMAGPVMVITSTFMSAMYERLPLDDSEEGIEAQQAGDNVPHQIMGEMPDPSAMVTYHGN
jgi:hypothetical protein